MLTRQNFRRSQKSTLISRFHGREQRHQGHQRLPGTDITLKQSQHRSSLCKIAFNLTDTAFLGIGQLERQLQLIAKPSVTLNGNAPLAAVAGTNQHESKLVGKNLVIGQPVVGSLAFSAMKSGDTILPILPFFSCKLDWLYPFGQFRSERERLCCQLAHPHIP